MDIRVEGTIPVDLPIADNKRFLFISHDQRAYTHGLHKYPAKFFPELPRWIIERYSAPGEMVLDPFMGSATTNIEASILGRSSIGVDVDPFSRFLSRVKTTPLPEYELLIAYDALKSKIQQKQFLLNGIPDFPYRENWFKPFVLKELSWLKHCIESISASKSIRDFFLVCFSSIIRTVSEADNNCTRTVIRKKLNKQVTEGEALRRFENRLEKNVRAMISYVRSNPTGTVTIPENADARKMPSVKNDSIDLALTSPPYANAVDYPRTHQLEIYWLGFASGSLKDMKAIHVGTEVVCARDYQELHNTGSSADETIAEIYSMDPRRAYIASKYIQDMISNMKEIHRKLKPGRKYVLVIGNNMIRGIRFETWRYLRDVAPSLGFEVETNFISAIINHFIKVPRQERINDDHVLVLKKCA